MLALKSLQFKEFFSTPLVGNLSVSFEYTQIGKICFCKGLVYASVQHLSLQYTDNYIPLQIT